MATLTCRLLSVLFIFCVSMSAKLIDGKNTASSSYSDLSFVGYKDKEDSDDLRQRLDRLEHVVTSQAKLITQLQETLQHHMTINKCKTRKSCVQQKKMCDRKYDNTASSKNINVRALRPRFLAEPPSDAVFFTTYLGAEFSSSAGNYVLPFHHVLTNEGDAFSSTTGKFTCPRNGVYLFSFFISILGAHETRTRLVIDGVNQVDALAEGDQYSSNDQGGNMAVLRVKQGQQVWVEVYDVGSATSPDYLYGAATRRHNTFSGVLLHS